jgi:hypothetical protein
VLIVPIEDAKPGMKLAMTVTHPEHPGQELLRRNFVLDDAVLRKMRELGVQHLFVDYPGLEDLDRHLAPNLSPERQALYSNMRSTMTDLERSREPSVNFHDYYDATRDFISTLLQNGRNPIYLDEMSARLGKDSVRHAMSVAHLALVMGIKLESYLITQRQRLTATQARDVVSLGVAGMLHDVGKMRLPEVLRQAHALNVPADAAARGEWESHVRIGYGMVRDEVEVTAAAAILNHHQHFDGSGFPPLPDLPQSGDRIHIFARILLAADLYDRLATTEDGRRRRSNLEILHLLQTRHANVLDPQVLATLPLVVPPFPPGSRVTLSDGRRAIVTGLDPIDAYRPNVRLAAEDGWTLTGESIVLIELPELRISEVGGTTVEELTPAA